MKFRTTDGFGAKHIEYRAGHVSGAERSEWGTERAKYSWSAELEQTEHRKRTRCQPKTIYWSLQSEKGFNRQALSGNKAAAHQFRPHRAVCPRLIRWETSGIAASHKSELAWNDFTGAEWNFRWAESGLWAELSGITLSDGAKQRTPK